MKSLSEYNKSRTEDLSLMLRETAFFEKQFIARRGNEDDLTQAPCEEVISAEKLIDTPDVSMVVLAYNCAAYLRECIDSILCQKTDYSFEIVISEDHSTDDTLNVAKALQREHPDLIRVIYAKVNVGLIRNFERVFKYCRGKYIAYTDGDDYYCNNRKIQLQADCLASNSDVVMTYTGSAFQLGRYKLIKNRMSKRTINRLIGMNNLEQRDFALSILKRNPITANSPMFRKDAIMYAVSKIKELHGLIEWFSVQDFEAWFFIATLGKVRFIRDITAVHRVHESSLSGTPDVSLQEVRSYGDFRIRLAIMVSNQEYFTDDDRDDALLKGFVLLARALAMTNEKMPLTLKPLCAECSDRLPLDVRSALSGDVAPLKKRILSEQRRYMGRVGTVLHYTAKAFVLNFLGF